MAFSITAFQIGTTADGVTAALPVTLVASKIAVP